jgi:glycerol-3-phosphate acyltransferase PlsY
MFVGNFFIYACSYLVGAVPTGFLVARARGIADIRQHGSGNIGATNVARSLGPYFFYLVLLLDAGKAFLNMFLLRYMGCSEDVIIFAASNHLIGNGYSIFLEWTGGKGIASLVGIFAVLQWQVLPITVLLWVYLFLETRVVAIASVVVIMILPLIAWLNGCSQHVWLFCLFSTVWVVIRHKNNIKQFFGHYFVRQ